MRWFKRGYVSIDQQRCYWLFRMAKEHAQFFSQAEHELLMKAKFMPNF